MPASRHDDKISSYCEEFREGWDSLVESTGSATVLHSRRFLDYHGSRFEDLSFVMRSGNDGEITAVFPIAAHPRLAGVAVSHAGSSFGGIVARLTDPLEHWHFFRTVAGRLLKRGYQSLVYRAVPSGLLPLASDSMLPALFKLGQLKQCDLWSVLGLADVPASLQRYWAHEIRRGERKGLHANAVHRQEDWKVFHDILAQRLRQKYLAEPVHSAAELFDLHCRLGAQSRGLLVRDARGVEVAALWFIDYGNGTLHNQYNAATEVGLRQGASSYGIALTIMSAFRDGGFRQFSFGRNTLDDGWSVNRKLMRFKQQFGAGLCAQFHFELDLAACCSAPEDFLSG